MKNLPRCQRKVFPTGPGRLGCFTGHEARCLKPGSQDALTVPEGTSVKLCRIHLKELYHRTEIGFHSPSDFYVWEKE